MAFNSLYFSLCHSMATRFAIHFVHAHTLYMWICSKDLHYICNICHNLFVQYKVSSLSLQFLNKQTNTFSGRVLFTKELERSVTESLVHYSIDGGLFHSSFIKNKWAQQDSLERCDTACMNDQGLVPTVWSNCSHKHCSFVPTTVTIWTHILGWYFPWTRLGIKRF